MKSPITTHVLDMALGCPARGLAITLEKQEASGEWKKQANGKTNDDGRIADLISGELQTGVYRMTFKTGPYFIEQKVKHFYPYVQVVFEIHETDQHYHVPLLLSPFGYSTYRGS